ncbi:ABC transporter substrate-binding protein [Devosia sp. BK]|jgi:polar amino acid transport system substrate-binding protein|uniref:ABC transporter substrate-binding protein n=1 Tax=unclassified Devosia TaxID=196773 RepID=UPI000715D737|nr:MULTISPECIES: ABC transporter substrate-binding protein [unclassified Devosia]KQN72484.1 amino acid ABC transporter substrate-binding protein [Devosia sp. Leaf64]MDV3251314.1 ABC transporter substrate-binding protein [Devosia sp. BK]
MAQKHNVIVAGLLAAIALVMPAVAQENTPNDPRLFTPGKLTVSTSEPSYPPWVLDNNPEAGEGFEAALVYALAEQLGFKRDDVVWVDVTFDGAIAPGPKNYDFSIQQISVTPDRAKVATFSDVYYQSDKAVIALPDSTVASAKSFADLKQARWGVAVGTTDFDYVTNVLGIDNAAVYDDQAGVFQALQGGQIDATIAALPTALYATAVQVPEAKITALLPKDPKDEGLALLFASGNPIVPWINEGLAAIRDSGKIDELVQKYLVADPNIPVINE